MAPDESGRLRADSSRFRIPVASVKTSSARRARNRSGRTSTATGRSWRVSVISSPRSTASISSGSSARAALTLIDDMTERQSDVHLVDAGRVLADHSVDAVVEGQRRGHPTPAGSAVAHCEKQFHHGPFEERRVLVDQPLQQALPPGLSVPPAGRIRRVRARIPTRRWSRRRLNRRTHLLRSSCGTFGGFQQVQDQEHDPAYSDAQRGQDAQDDQQFRSL